MDKSTQKTVENAPTGLHYKNLKPHSLEHNECMARIEFAKSELRKQMLATGVPHEQIEGRLNQMARRFYRRFARR